jgi:magnesium-transporting ATPase (P-type)
MSTVVGQIHEIASESVFDLLRSRASGLNAREVRTRRETVGLNKLEPPSRWGWVRRLAKHFVNFFSILLDVAAGVCFIAASIQPEEGMAVLGWALGGVSVLNSLFAFAQELRAEHAMAELAKFLPQQVRVRREGREVAILAEELVPGDLLVIREGDRIAADARLIESEELLVNNAPLTGEARSIALHTQACHGPLAESANIAFAGCSVLRGSGIAVVFATGHQTEFGKIAAFSRDVSRSRCPLQRETVRMVRILTVIAVAMGLLFFAYGVISGRSLWINIVFMLGIIVANVPEGLLPTFTLALSMASLRMARKQVLVKNLEAVETLGAVHVICTDKTGTLTENALAVAALVDPLDGKPFEHADELHPLLRAAVIASEVHPATKPPRGSHRPRHARSTRGAPAMRFIQLIRIMLGLRRWPSRVRSKRPRKDERRLEANWTGDPLDIAVVEHYTAQFGTPIPILQEIQRHFPFDLARRREAGLLVHGNEVVFAVKGAWESLQPLISQIRHREGHVIPATADRLAQCESYVRQLACQGQRVIAVAARTFPDHAQLHDTAPDGVKPSGTTPSSTRTSIDSKLTITRSLPSIAASEGPIKFNSIPADFTLNTVTDCDTFSLSEPALSQKITRVDQVGMTFVHDHSPRSPLDIISPTSHDMSATGPSTQGVDITDSASVEWRARSLTDGLPADRSSTPPEAAPREDDLIARLLDRQAQDRTRSELASTSLEQDLVLYGFLALEDPIRPDVAEAVDRCHAAGIQVLMVTGDHPDTAVAIARRCHILPEQGELEGRVVLGAELATLREQQLVNRLAAGATIFARSTPEQKMKIVSACKRLGKIVGMTGDGVNDSPALKAADVGIAMGLSGTDVAREAADLVLLDDHFASIVAGIEEGRAVFANMQRFTTYVLSSNVPEIVPFLLYIVLPVPLALTVIQILSIDLGTDLLPAIGLGQEPPDRDTMSRPPRRGDERLLSLPVMLNAYLFLGLLQATFSLGLFFLVLVHGGWQWGMPLAENTALYRSATGVTLASVILMQIGNVIGRRSPHGLGLDRGIFKNPLLILGIAVEIVFSWSILYFPPVQKVLQTGPVELVFYLLAWAGIPCLLGFDWLRKQSRSWR